jgi:F-type H+-transporting ATPase subunit delta
LNWSAIAERYARAIVDLGVEENQLGPLTEQLGRFYECYAQSAELREVLDNPSIVEPSREAVLREVASRLGLGKTALNALRLLAARRRLRALPEIARQLGVLSDERARVLRARITTCVSLSEDYYQRVALEMERVTGRKVVLERRQDASLIGGVLIQLGDHTIDGSIRGRLSEIERRLLQAS